MAEHKEIDDLNDGFPKNFDAKIHKLRGNDASMKQDGAIEEYTIERVGTITRKTKPIFECIGQLLMDFGDEDGSMRSGTGTVIKKLSNHHLLVLTCAHNLVKFHKITNTREEIKKVWFLPKGCTEIKCRLQLVHKAIYSKYNPENDLCPHDLAVVLFYDKKGSNGSGSKHYDDVDVDKLIQVIEWKDEDEPELNLYGYPSKSKGLLQGLAGEVELERERGLWMYDDIYTFPGHSGSVLFKRIRRNEYGVCGVHIFGDTVTQQNCGIFLDTEKREWIKVVMDEFTAMANANEKELSAISSRAISMERLGWKVGSNVQTYSRAQGQWIPATIIKVFTHNYTEWLLLKCVDNALVEIERQNDNLQPENVPILQEHRLIESTTSSALPDLNQTLTMVYRDNTIDLNRYHRKDAFVFKKHQESLKDKLRQVLTAINHAIDSNQRFLHQIYHGHKDNVHKYLTYDNDKAMRCFSEMQRQQHPAVMLCNGSVIGSYGDRSRCAEWEREANTDYNAIKPYLHHVLLNTKHISREWTASEYDVKQWFSMQRDDIICKLTDIETFQIPTIQIAVQLYDKLMATLKSDYDESVEDLQDIDDDKYKEIMFLWTKKQPNKDENELNIASLDMKHFLYIVSLIFNDLKRKYDKVDISMILRCLYDIKMNGFVFNNIERIVFKRSIIMYSHSSTEIEIESFRQLMRLITDLWKQIRDYNLSQIQPSSICNVSFCSEQNVITDDTQQKGDDKTEREPDDVPIFERWMITFNSMYNRNTPFNFEIFTDLMKIYTEDRNVIVDIKYENYATDLTDKTYDHVLKSFIAWTITLKCSNLRCNEKPKLKCFCDTNTFQLYTYNIIMQLIALKANHNCALLNTLCDTKQSVTAITKEFCNILSDTLKENEYFKSYELLVSEWINFEFYNFVCNYCHHINKSIMIGRIYEYSKLLDSCRICNKLQISRMTNNSAQFDINEAVQKKNSAITELYEQHTEFTLPSLSEYLSKYNISNNVLSELFGFIIAEHYDSDALIDDIDDDNDSNIQTFIQESQSKTYYHLVHQFLNYHRYPTYQTGKFIRYLVLKPKFSSLIKEICLNGIYPLSIQEWNDHILIQVIKEYKKKVLRSTITDKRFGIEEGEPIGINHLISIFLFTGNTHRFQKYRLFFSKSFYLWSETVHCNNFYWIGRYLYEAVQFYGKNFANDLQRSTLLYRGLQKIKSFDSIAPTLNAPILITDDMERNDSSAQNRGCALALAPKYYGHIDNSKSLDTHLFNKTIRILMGTKVQLRSIQIGATQRFDNTALAMQYIEKILTQTVFNAQYFNADELYSPQNMKRAYLLILDAVDNRKSNKDAEHTTHPYIRHLFDNWCIKRDFVTFETFRFEMHFMNYKLKQFLFDEEKNKINIMNVKKFLPNLKHYHDINGILRNVEVELKRMNIAKTDDDVEHGAFGLLYNCQEHYIPHHIVDALTALQYNFKHCKGVLREALRMRLSKLDINSALFYRHSDEFTTQLVSIGIEEKVAEECIKNVKSVHSKSIHQRTDTDTLITYLLEELKKEKWRGVKCNNFMLKIAFQNLYSGNLKVFNKTIMNRDNVTVKDLYSVAKDIEIFDQETAISLSRYLYIKLIDEKHKAQPWICRFCDFLNRKLMVDGLWRYYNEANNCGLCGGSRRDDTTALPRMQRKPSTIYQSIEEQKSPDINKYKPDIDTERWGASDTKCTLHMVGRRLSNNQLLYEDILSHCPALQRVEIVLEHFQTLTNQLSMTNNVYPYIMKCFLSSFPDYGTLSFLDDIDHINGHKLKRPQKCAYGSTCIHMQRTPRYPDEFECRILEFSTARTDFVYISMLDRVHCLFNHSEEIGMPMNKYVELLKADVRKTQYVRYGMGVYMEYHTLKPLFKNLYEEIVNAKSMGSGPFFTELEAAKLMKKEDRSEWRACKTDEKHGIKINEPMHIEHVLCIKLYCNYDDPWGFLESYLKKRAEDTGDDIIQRHCMCYWFGRFLTSALEFWGKTPKKNHKSYRGLSNLFVFDHFSTLYEIPTSTTSDRDVAYQYSRGTGVVLTLSPKYSDEINNTRCLDLVTFINNKEEREILFAGMTVLSITDIHFQYHEGKKSELFYGSHICNSMLYFERIIEQTNQTKNHYNYGHIDKECQHQYLVPLIKHQMNKNTQKRTTHQRRFPQYIYALVQHFCDNKRDHIDLSCIKDEIPLMTESLKEILFEDIQFVEASASSVREFKINNRNITRIFPNLLEYKNHVGNWIYVGR